MVNKTSSVVKSKVFSKQNVKVRLEIQEALRLGTLLSEKCELEPASELALRAYRLAKKIQDFRAMMEAISSLLRLASEALNHQAIDSWEKELDDLIAKHPSEVPPMIWHCKGTIAFRRKEYPLAQRLFHRSLRRVRSESEDNSSAQILSQEEMIARGWNMLALTLRWRGKPRRALLLAKTILSRYENKNLRGINGWLYLFLGQLEWSHKHWDESLKWFQQAHGSFMSEHNWYSYLYVLHSYAYIARKQQNYPLAYWYLDLLEKATLGAGFGALRKMIEDERKCLEQDAVDLLIDSRKGIVKTKENGQISLRKQYILLGILEALTTAHSKEGADNERALSKGEIIKHVWKEAYRPEIHDNKLYYNINRLRKLIEPDLRQPQYLLNWKEGYRLAPSLRIRFVGQARGESGTAQKKEGEYYEGE